MTARPTRSVLSSPTGRGRTVVAAVLALVLAGAAMLASAGSAGATSYTTIEGSGSTWSQIIVQQWISQVAANGLDVVYSGGGSSKGRKDFANGITDFAISEIPYQGVDPSTGQADKSDRPYAYLPIVAGGTSFTYQLKIGTRQVKNLRLSGETLAKIFTNQITNWNDPAIAKDNGGQVFPSLAITPVVRSDGSGTTAQFTAWMDSQYPSIWRPYFGRSGLTSYYPTQGRMLAQNGSDQVMNTITSSTGNGTIGYVEYSYALNANYPVIKVLNKAGYYVEPTEYNTAVALTRATINRNKSDPTTYLTQNLTGVYTNSDPRAYPISSYSYMIIPTAANDPKMTTSKRQTLADFLYYDLCQGQTQAGPFGYSPLPLNLVQAGFDQIAQLKKADPAVDLTNRDVKSCNNPTFDGKDPNKNVLAEIAPQPAACDKAGAIPCGTDTGTNTPSTDGDSTPGSGGSPTPSADPSGAAGPGGPAVANPTATAPGGTAATPGPGASPSIDPETGQNVAAAGDGTGAASEIYANPTLVSGRPIDSRTFGWVAVIELGALVLVPGLVVASLRRRRREGAR